jgi:hypothetical protein
MRPVQRGRRNASASPDSDDVVPETRQASPAPVSPLFAAQGAVSEREEVDNQADIETEDEGVAEEEEHAADQLVWGQPTDEDREEVESQAATETEDEGGDEDDS